MKYKDFLKEKELLLDSIENNTSEHWKNYYKDVPIECIYDDLVIDINEIKRLQQENQELKDRINNTVERLEALITFWKKYNPIDNTMQVEQFNGVISLLKENNKEKVDE